MVILSKIYVFIGRNNNPITLIFKKLVIRIIKNGYFEDTCNKVQYWLTLFHKQLMANLRNHYLYHWLIFSTWSVSLTNRHVFKYIELFFLQFKGSFFIGLCVNMIIECCHFLDLSNTETINPNNFSDVIRVESSVVNNFKMQITEIICPRSE